MVDTKYWHNINALRRERNLKRDDWEVLRKNSFRTMDDLIQVCLNESEKYDLVPLLQKLNLRRIEPGECFTAMGKADGFVAGRENHYVIFLNLHLPIFQILYTLGHELGHLIAFRFGGSGISIHEELFVEEFGTRWATRTKNRIEGKKLLAELFKNRVVEL